MPYLRMYGKLDGLVPRKAIEPINVLSPDSDVVILEKASHAPFISHPEEFHQALILWLLPLLERFYKGNGTFTFWPFCMIIEHINVNIYQYEFCYSFSVN